MICVFAFLDWFNVERVSAFAQLITGLAVTVGVFITWRQLKQWKNQALASKKADVAERLLVNVYDAFEAISSVRRPMEQLLKDSDREHGEIEQKIERLYNYNDTFEKLRHSQVLARAIIGNKSVDENVSEIFKIRSEVSAALQTLHSRTGEVEDQRLKDFYWKLEMIMYETRGKHDEIWPRESAGIEKIEEALFPIVQLEK